MIENSVEYSINKEGMNRYTSVDGIRSVAAVGIVLMHVRANGSYSIEGTLFNRIIPFFTNFVFLFMIASAFSLCCGYYERIFRGDSAISDFYRKRYAKIFPFFAILVALDCLLSPSPDALTEAFADLTLCFGLLPNANISVIGVGWFLGTVFVFYMLFPFFCFLIRTKKSAWVTFCISILYNIACTEYFMNVDHVVESFSNRTSIVFCAMFFVAGGLIYLYRDVLAVISTKYQWPLLGVIVVVSAGYFLVQHDNENLKNFWMLVMFSGLLIYALNNHNRVLSNKVTKFLSSISMEIYLSHMVVFRGLEKLHINYTGWVGYIIAFALVFAGTLGFSLCVKWGLKFCGKVIGRSRGADNV